MLENGILQEYWWYYKRYSVRRNTVEIFDIKLSKTTCLFRHTFIWTDHGFSNLYHYQGT